jgi:hypothetical protein
MLDAQIKMFDPEYYQSLESIQTKSPCIPYTGIILKKVRLESDKIYQHSFSYPCCLDRSAKR